jgi:nicotinamide phosphoribosyltransferase
MGDYTDFKGEAWWDDTNPIFLIDFYKFGHVDQYPKGIKKIWVNFTPRSTRVEGETGVIFFGLQRFIKRVLIQQFNDYFFDREWVDVEREYKKVMKATLGVDARVDHIKQLFDHGSLPLDIYAVPEGTYVPLGVPAMVIVNNQDWAFWLPNYIETMCSNSLWHACTSASTALRYRRLFKKHAKAAGETDLSFIDWQGHDFSYRGLSGFDSAVLSGMGHLLSFNGTDTLPAILDAKKYYHANLSCGGSVPATEHSVMCAGSKESERETFRRLIEDVYPNGIVSIVSDTWDLWKVLTEIIPSLKDSILARDGKVVIRPDSGDPVKILTGDDNAVPYSPEWHGAAHLLSAALGYTRAAYTTNFLKMINKAGLIYGDSITVDRADQILTRAAKKEFHPYNFVFGIGSYTYQYVTRDTYNFAFKATAIERWIITDENGTGYECVPRVEAIFKDPVTDNAHKKSHRGIPVAVFNPERDDQIEVVETLDPRLLDGFECDTVFKKVFNGALLLDDTFDAIRQRVRGQA